MALSSIAPRSRPGMMDERGRVGSADSCNWSTVAAITGPEGRTSGCPVGGTGGWSGENIGRIKGSARPDMAAQWKI